MLHMLSDKISLPGEDLRDCRVYAPDGMEYGASQVTFFPIRDNTAV